ncbi:MAG: hypothetical protein ABIJ45_06960 [Candidatus Zixiibacteriota bacterium]
MNGDNSKCISVLIGITLLVFMGITGCSKNPTISEPSSDLQLLSRDLGAAKIEGLTAYMDTILVASEGGRVSLYDVDLYFPPGALSTDTLISIDIPDLAVFANNFGTNGLQFNVPVRVVMNYRDADLTGINESNIAMAWFNTRTGNWDVIDCQLDTNNKTVTAFVNHFSAYALISD